MLTTLSTNLEPPAAGRVAGITRLMRQICLLREQGDTGRAARLHEHDLAAAVRDLRAAHGAEALLDDELRTLFAAEEQRVAEAVMLAAAGFESPRVKLAGSEYKRFVAVGALKAARSAREDQWQHLLA